MDENNKMKFMDLRVANAVAADDVAKPPFKYSEDKIVDDLYDYLKSTYGEHYATEEDSVQCFDAWIAMGDATPTFRNTAIKYLWRYGKKNGNNKKDLMKALHYIVLCLHNDHYRGK